MGRSTFAAEIILSVTDPQTQLPASSVYPSYHLKPHPYPISRFATMRWIDETDRHTDQHAVGGMFDVYRPFSLYKESAAA